MSSPHPTDKRNIAITCRKAEHGDAEEITSLFLIRFPWLNHMEDARKNTCKNVHQRIDDPQSITLVRHLEGRLDVVLRGQLEADNEFVIDAFCTDDTLDPKTRSRLAPSGFRLMLPGLIDFARQRGAVKITFDTHVASLPALIIKMIDRLKLPMKYLGNDGTAHSFRLCSGSGKAPVTYIAHGGAPVKVSWKTQ